MALLALSSSLNNDLIYSNFLQAADRIQLLLDGQNLSKSLGVRLVDVAGVEKLKFDPSGVSNEKKASTLEETIYFDEGRKNPAYRLQVTYVPQSFAVENLARLLMFPSLLVVLALLGLFGLGYFTRTLFRRATELIESGQTQIHFFKWVQVKELQSLKETVLELSRKRGELVEARVAEGTANQLSLFSSLIVHDIKQPLSTVLKLVDSLEGTAPAHKLTLIQQSLRRIQSTTARAFDSAGVIQSVKTPRQDGQSKVAAEQIIVLVESLLTEKRELYAERTTLEIEAVPQSTDYGFFASIDGKEFLGLLSNIVDNSAEAIEGAGQIWVSLGESPNGIVVKITDTGRGIPDHVLPKLMQVGATYGKPGGSGLGLYHARVQVESWGGKIQIESRPGLTTVSIHLPRAPIPAWILPELRLPASNQVAILDDDPGIHGLWKLRLGDTVIQHCFRTGTEFTNWVKSLTSERRNEFLFLCDFELKGEKATGLEIIEALGIAKNSVLVTGRIAETSVTEGCLRVGVKAIPKSALSRVPIVK
ncbi:MAG: HAMP domain-containing histidine kinase [Bdellovibrionales bacterium]|nr:HAMP domain-containing histidine kinase [Bdellovibrionales bacterium]